MTTAKTPKYERKICWPDPDAVCIEGGCGYCNRYRYQSVDRIERFAQKNGLMDAFDFGLNHNWNNAQSRAKRTKESAK